MKRWTRRALLVAGGVVAGATAAVAAERAMVRQARSRPDPERGEPLAERPGRERRVRSFDGTELAVNVVGPEDAPTVVFSHGFTVNMTVWHYQWKRLSKRYRCVLYDHRGHGRSERARTGDYSLRALGLDLKAVLADAAPAGPVAVMGHSMGGMAIMALAEQHPEEFARRIGAVVLADTSASDLVRELVSGLGTRASALLARRVARLVGGKGAAARLRGRALARRSPLAFLVAEATNFGPHAPPSLIDFVVSLSAEARPEVWTDLMASLVEMNLTEALRHITVPTLVMVGDVDRLTPPASALAITRNIPNARLVVLKGAGHCSMLERHHQFNRVVEGFLEESLGSASEPPTAAASGGRS